MIPDQYTHYGWLFMCPVYVGGLNSEAPYINARSALIDWWLNFNLGLFGVCVFCMELIDPDYEPMFPIRLTGEIKRHSVTR